jgi:osmoprotectant transport system permease protein
MLRIIPSLAILFLLIPIIGTGTKPALIALVILGIPSILLHTILGFKEVPERVAETGIAIGMTQRQLLRKVRIPLALPYILNGIKIALIEIIASATLAAKIGAGGLGSLIFTGLGLNRTDLLVIGGLSVAVLSLLSSLFIERIEKMMIT